MKILMVLTSHDQLGDTGKKTGFWLEELAAPYYALKDAGAEIVLASPKGGQPPLDPKRPRTRAASRPMPRPRPPWARPSNCRRSRPRISTRSSIRAATDRCGTSPTIRPQSP